MIASKEPLDELSASSLRQKRFNAVTQKQCKAIELELGEEEPFYCASLMADRTTTEITAGPGEYRNPRASQPDLIMGTGTGADGAGHRLSAASSTRRSVASQSMQASVMDWPWTRSLEGRGKGWLPATRLLSSMAPTIERVPEAR